MKDRVHVARELVQVVAGRLDWSEADELFDAVLLALTGEWQAGYDEAVRQHDEEGSFVLRRPNALRVPEGSS